MWNWSSELEGRAEDVWDVVDHVFDQKDECEEEEPSSMLLLRWNRTQLSNICEDHEDWNKLINIFCDWMQVLDIIDN